jgi:ABC-type branched-subunit amino acid transport system ATPase component
LSQILIAEALVKRFGEFTPVHGVSFEIAEGDT